jgi:hypothetical protein
MTEIDKILSKSTEKLNRSAIELAMSNIEVNFTNRYQTFLKDGDWAVFFQTEFIKDKTPLSLIYKTDDTQIQFPYGGLDHILKGVFANDIKGKLADYPKYTVEGILSDANEIPGLDAYVGKIIKIETTSYFLKSQGDGKLRKIEYSRYLDEDNNDQPIAEIWQGKSWNPSNANLSNYKTKTTPTFA